MVVGEHERGAVSTVRQIHDVASIFIHEDYNSRTMENDIAVIKTVLDIVMVIQVQPICAPDPTNTYHYSKSQVAGWGTINEGRK